MATTNRVSGAADQGRADILALGFGTATAMWTAGYIAHLPGIAAPAWLALALMLLALLGGGYLAGSRTARGWLGGLYAGLTAGLLNLLILGSLVGEASKHGGAPGAMLALAVSVLATGALAALAAALGALRYDPAQPQPDWTHVFARVAAATTLLLIFAGGLVTSTNSGLAVPDWPGSFGNVMWFLPLADMTGGVYFEHAHRLLGSLVGLTCLVLLLQLWRTPADRPAKQLAAVIFALVCLQGVLGGMRVTDKSIPLAVIHGISAQVIFALLALLVALTAPAFRALVLEGQLEGSSGDIKLSKWLAGLLLVQLTLGTLFRQGITAHESVTDSAWGMAHVMLALIVVGVAIVAGLRARKQAPYAPGLARTGKSILHTVGLQFVLGIAAYVTVMLVGPLAPAAVVIATLHQTNGALLLGAAAMLVAWNLRAVEAGK